MSFDAIRWALRQKLRGTDKMVLVVLADAHNKHTGQLNLEKQTIADRAGFCKRTCDDAAIRLRELGLINFDSESGNKSNQYDLSMDDETVQELQGISPSYPAGDSANPAGAAPDPALTSKNQKKHKVITPNSLKAQTVVDIYHEHLPMCPAVRKLTKPRETKIKARLAQDLKTPEAWSDFFQYVAASKFLTGQVEPNNGHKRFCANLEWLTTESNFVKVIEGQYE